ncbi:MAG: LptF/LptG family permease [Elusimicrobia bacterium]|nr:LptF/LptG family permease [Elusimicrobiota bacterium]
MSIFSWYMVRRFSKPFLFGLGLFAVLIFLGDLFNKMHQLMKSHASLWIILQYLWLDVPYWGVRIIPMATLLATLVAITGFIQSGEWLAGQACGFESRTFWKPLVGCALAVTVLCFAAQETILPACYHRVRQLWEDRIYPEWDWDVFQGVAFVVGPERFVSAQTLFVKAGQLERPVLEDVGTDGVARQLDALKASWDASLGRWVFLDGVERIFDKGVMRETPFKRKVSELDLPPRTLVPKTVDPDEMSLLELLSYSRRMRRLGAPVTQLRVAAHAKVAYPFTNVIFCALGIPIAMRLRRSPMVVNFCVAMAISFLFLWFIELGKALGASGRLPPVAAAWTPNLVFGGLAAGFIKRWAWH